MGSVSGKSLIMHGGHAVCTVFNFLWENRIRRICGHAVCTVFNFLWVFGMKIPIIGCCFRTCGHVVCTVFNFLWENRVRRILLWHVTPGIKVFIVLTGNTLGSHESFLKLLANQFNLEKVSSVEDCDVILAFCPIVSRVGTDIGAALSVIPECRPAVLVVFHHTNDEHYIIPNTSRFAQDRKIPTVDCLFNDGGLLQTHQNDKAFRRAMECLKSFQKNEMNAFRRLTQH